MLHLFYNIQLYLVGFYSQKVNHYTGLAELADARDLKSRDRNIVWVQLPYPVPYYWDIAQWVEQRSPKP